MCNKYDFFFKNNYDVEYISLKNKFIKYFVREFLIYEVYDIIIYIQLHNCIIKSIKHLI
jgi:hypothetical protein